MELLEKAGNALNGQGGHTANVCLYLPNHWVTKEINIEVLGRQKRKPKNKTEIVAAANIKVHKESFPGPKKFDN